MNVSWVKVMTRLLCMHGVFAALPSNNGGDADKGAASTGAADVVRGFGWPHEWVLGKELGRSCPRVGFTHETQDETHLVVCQVDLGLLQLRVDII